MGQRFDWRQAWRDRGVDVPEPKRKAKRGTGPGQRQRRVAWGGVSQPVPGSGPADALPPCDGTVPFEPGVFLHGEPPCPGATCTVQTPIERPAGTALAVVGAAPARGPRPEDYHLDFGRHKGKRLGDVETGYLVWLTKTVLKNDPAVSAHADAVLQTRRSSKPAPRRAVERPLAPVPCSACGAAACVSMDATTGQVAFGCMSCRRTGKPFLTAFAAVSWWNDAESRNPSRRDRMANHLLATGSTS